MQQIKFDFGMKDRLWHGGESSKGKRKTKRTIFSNKWIHLVLKSKKAVGKMSFWHKANKNRIESLIRQKAKKHFVEIKSGVNMGNHFHLQIRVKHPIYFRAFLRSISGAIARMVTGAKRGKKFGKFWDALAFTRVLTSSFEILQLRGYFKANRIERDQGYQAREEMLKKFNKWLYELKNSSHEFASTYRPEKVQYQ